MRIIAFADALKSMRTSKEEKTTPGPSVSWLTDAVGRR